MKALGYLLAVIFAGLAAFAFVSGNQFKTSVDDQIAAATKEIQTELDAVKAERLVLVARVAELEQKLKATGAELDLQPTGPTVEVVELKAKLEKTQDTVEALKVAATAQPEAETEQASREEDWQARRAREMEEMKQNDPEAYKERMERRTTMRTEMKQGITERMEFFHSLDLSDLPAELQTRHQELLARMSEMGQTFDALLENPEADLDFMAMRESMGVMNEIMQEERGILMQDFAKNLGFEGEEANKMLETLDYIRDMTSPPRPSSGRGGPPRGGGGGR